MLQQRTARDSGGEPCPAAPVVVEEFGRVGAGQLLKGLSALGPVLAVCLATGRLNPQARCPDGLTGASMAKAPPGCSYAVQRCKCTRQGPLLPRLAMAARRRLTQIGRAHV